VIFTLPPGHTAISQGEYIRNGFLPAAFVLGLRNFVRSQHCEEFVTHIHAKIMNGRPHYYLWGLVVDPACQRKGVGTALLKPFLQKADSEKMPVYLETHDEKNVAYYQWQGFDLRQATMISKYDIPIWCMVREPKGTSGT
jgi:GNAT superfamily N-acetyltransferase